MGRHETRLYRLYRGNIHRYDEVQVDKRGTIVAGPFLGGRIVDLLKPAADKGWLAFTLRNGDWHSAEWCQERKTVALCGPVQHSSPDADVELGGVIGQGGVSASLRAP